MSTRKLEAASGPLHWWEILSASSAALPFRTFFLEGGPAPLQEAAEMLSERELTLLQSRIVEPVQGWDAYLQAAWGDDAGLIEEWFDAGEHDAGSGDLIIEQPERWGRARHVVRSLAAVTKLIPA